MHVLRSKQLNDIKPWLMEQQKCHACESSGQLLTVAAEKSRPRSSAMQFLAAAWLTGTPPTWHLSHHAFFAIKSTVGERCSQERH